MGYCSHNQAIVNRENDKIEKYTNEMNNCIDLKGQATSIKAMLESFAQSIKSVGYYLSYVKINNDSFDKGECETQANNVLSLVDDIDAFIASLDAAISEYESDIKACQSTINSLSSLCYSCQVAAQQQEEARKAAAQAASSGSGGGGGARTRVAMVR